MFTKKALISITEDIEPGVFYNQNGIKITAFDVAHLPLNPETEELLGLEGSYVWLSR
jgi:hypothetical protein